VMRQLQRLTDRATHGVAMAIFVMAAGSAVAQRVPFEPVVSPPTPATPAPTDDATADPPDAPIAPPVAPAVEPAIDPLPVQPPSGEKVRVESAILGRAGPDDGVAGEDPGAGGLPPAAAAPADEHDAPEAIDPTDDGPTAFW